MPHEGLAGAIHVVEQCDKALLHHFGQQLGQRLAQADAVAEQFIVQGIEKRGAVLRAFHRTNEGRGLGQNLAQQLVFLFQPPLGVAQLVHVQHKAVAPPELAGRVQLRHGLGQEPAVLAVGPAQAHFHPPQPGLRNAFLNFVLGALTVVGVQRFGPGGIHVGPGAAGQLAREGVPLRTHVNGVALGIGGEGDDGQGRSLAAQALVGGPHFRLQGFGLAAGQHLRGYVHAKGQHAGYLPVVIAQGLVAEVEVDLPPLAIRRVLKLEGHLLAFVRLAGAVHGIEQLDKSLAPGFGKAFGGGAAQAGPVLGQRVVPGVGEGVAVLRAFEGSHRGRALAQYLGEALGAGRCRTKQLAHVEQAHQHVAQRRARGRRARHGLERGFPVAEGRCAGRGQGRFGCPGGPQHRAGSVPRRLEAGGPGSRRGQNVARRRQGRVALGQGLAGQGSRRRRQQAGHRRVRGQNSAVGVQHEVRGRHRSKQQFEIQGGRGEGGHKQQRSQNAANWARVVRGGGYAMGQLQRSMSYSYSGLLSSSRSGL